jgi:N-acetyl sugar amidotransferase
MPTAVVDIDHAAGGGPPVLQRCTRCVMDGESNPITFDADGVCHYCRELDAKLRLFSVTAKSDTWLEGVVAEVKRRGAGKPYDCILGVSGGTDSTYVAYKAKELGLRPLAVHCDNGWNSELSVRNIEQTLKTLDIELYTHVLDWEEFRSLQLSFLRASVSDGEIPTDHAIWAVLYEAAEREGVTTILTGLNVASEGILPGEWTYGTWDWKYISGVHRRFGGGPLGSFPHRTMTQVLRDKFAGQVQELALLNHVPYVKHEAAKILEERLGWRNYGGKHYESIYTRFFQGYILPRKFHIDKRKAHLSTLIGSGQITREAALAELATDPYGSAELQAVDKEFVLKKLELTEREFEEILALPVRTYRDYPNNSWYLKKAVVGTWLRRVGLVGRRAS